jgi:hypothetical protein
LGVVATVAAAVREGSTRPQGLTDRVLELPVLAVSTALQYSLRAQQRYTALTVRGDELLTQLRGGASDDPPPWATFEDDVAPPAAQPQPGTAKKSSAKSKATKSPTSPAPVSRQPVAKKAAAKPGPRTGKPSAFDLVSDDLVSDDLVSDDLVSDGLIGDDGVGGDLIGGGSARTAGGDLP